MINRSALVVYLLIFASGVDADHASEQVQAWLERMHVGNNTLSFDGTFVYSRDNSISAMRIVRSVTDSGVRERLVSLGGNGREVIRDKDSVVCILPDRETVVVEKGRPKSEFPPKFPMKIGKLEAYYEFYVDEDVKERVAGQPTALITITPKDSFRYGYRLWVDRKTGLLLKSRLLDGGQSPVEQFMFTQIEYLDKVPEELLQPAVDGKEFAWYEADGGAASLAKAAGKAWEFSGMPPGFDLDVQRAHNLARSKNPADHLVLSDGLASVSVFIENHDEDDTNLIGGSRMGAINAYGREMNGYHVTAVGEVPQAAVKLISESVRYKNSTQ